MSIRIHLTPKQEFALSGGSVLPVTRRSLVRLGLMTREGEITPSGEDYLAGRMAFKPERTKA